VAVHLFGQPADVEGLRGVARDAGIPLVEDAAQAHGAREDGAPVGSLGSIAAFSFYPTKNLGAIGDAGAITTEDPVLAERVRALREYGWHTRADAEIKGINARIDELQAALLRVMLPRLKDGTERRRAIARSYLEGLAGIEELELPYTVPSAEHVWHLFVVRHPRRAALAEALGSAGITTAVHYETLPPLNSAFAADGWRKGTFPVAEHHAATALSLPMHPALADIEVEFVIEAMRTITGEI
jgi:dTDP-4-amino-4,6-dideoxygalactose transaminase